MEHERTIERFDKESGKWMETKFSNLTNGDIFRIFDLGERYVNTKDGNNVWIAKGDPFLNKDNIWAIHTLY